MSMMFGSLLLLMATLLIELAVADIIAASAFGAGSQLLKFNQSLVWGPLDVPARVTVSRVRITNST